MSRSISVFASIVQGELENLNEEDKSIYKSNSRKLGEFAARAVENGSIGYIEHGPESIEVQEDIVNEAGDVIIEAAEYATENFWEIAGNALKAVFT